MFARGIRAHIIINMVVILLVAMLLINIVLIFMSQRYLMNRLSVDANIICNSVTRLYEKQGSGAPAKNGFASEIEQSFLRLMRAKGVVNVIVLDSNGQQTAILNDTEVLQNTLLSLLDRTLLEKRSLQSYAGSGWGVLWRYHQFLLKTQPIVLKEGEISACGIVFSLSPIHKVLRKFQKIAFLYIVINTVILASFGSYRIFRIYFRPVQRLVKRAEEYKDHSEFFFNVRKEDDELGKLSSALNNMLNRISKDQLMLRSSVENLEVVNQQLKAAQNEIIRAEKLASIGRLSSGIAHEIGNPIGIVLGYLDLLKQKDLDPPSRRDYILRAENEINRINTIIRQLLDFSRSSAEKMVSVSVHEIITEIIDVISKQPLMSGIQIEQHLNASDDRVLVDPEQLRQVFLNLFINSADAILSMENRAHGKICVATTLETIEEERLSVAINRMKIRITDTGPGIAEDDIENIFDPFYTTKEPGKGTGLGLYVSLMIVEKFGGTISVESRMGEGTTMNIILGLAQ